MSILSVDNISPIGSGTSVTINNAATLVLNNLNVAGVITATSLDISGDIDVDGHTNLDNTDIVGILTVTSTTQYGGYKLSNNSSIVGELVGLSGSNDTGALALWSGGSKYVQLSAIGNSYLTGGSLGIGTISPSVLLDVQGHAGSGAQTTIRSKSTAANASNFVRSESSDGLYIGLLKYGTGHSAYGALPAGGGAVYANSSVPITIMSDGGSGYINFATGGNTERLRIDSAGRFLKGLTSAGGSRSSTSVRYPHFQLSSPWTSGLGSLKIECTDDYPIIFIDSNASYASGSGAGVITWSVKDSSGDYCNTASVRSQIDATPSNDSAPGRLQFMTTTSGATPTTKMTISSQGYVTTPNQPSFNAYINGFTSESANTGTQIMPFNATNTNVGGHFKTSGTDQYKFVAPVAGNYYFSLSQNHNARVDTRILKNGSTYHGGESETTNQNWWDHHHLSCIIPLAVGDKVHCTTNNQDGSGKRAWNSGYWESFSGFLIG